MKHTTKLVLSFSLLAGFTSLVRAAEPATQPAVNSDDSSKDAISDVLPPSTSSNPARPADGTEDGRPRRPDRERPRLRFLQPYDQKEVDDAMQFMQNHSPERFKFVSALPEGEKKTGIKNFATRAYQSWMRLSHDDWKLYAVVMKRVGVEDEIFGLVAQLRDSQARNEPAEKQQAINAQLHEKVVSLVDIGLKERQIRLDNLSRTVKDEQQKLNADSSDTKALVEKRMQSILTDEKLFLPVTNGLAPAAPPRGSAADSEETHTP